MRAGSTSMLGQTLGGTRLFVRTSSSCGVRPMPRYRPSSGVEPPSARIHLTRTGQKLDPARPGTHVLSPRPRPRAQVSASLRACGRAELALPRRCAGCRPDGAAPRAKVFSWPLISSRRYTVLLWSTSGPNGPRRRLRRRVPVNPGRRAGSAARETAAGRAVGRAAGDLPPRPPPEASVESRPKRRCDPARHPRPRSRRFTRCPGPWRCL